MRRNAFGAMWGPRTARRSRSATAAATATVASRRRGTSCSTRRLDRIIASDWATGVLRCEAGITLEQILRRRDAARLVPAGHAGHQVRHARRRHRQRRARQEPSRARHLRPPRARFGLLRSDGSQVDARRRSTQRSFAATIGGLGLTGLITWAEIQLMPIRSSLDRRDKHSVREPRRVLLAVRATRRASTSTPSPGSTAWPRRGARTRHFMRRRSRRATAPLERRATPASAPCRSTPPVSLINGLSVRAFNVLYYRRQRPPQGSARGSATIAFSIRSTACSTGTASTAGAGFQQYQCVVPADGARCDARDPRGDSSSRAGLVSRRAQAFGDIRSPDCCRFRSRAPRSRSTFRSAKRVTRGSSRRSTPSCAKPAAGSIRPRTRACRPPIFAAAYPQWQQLEAHRDPAMLSRFWERMIKS